MTSVLVVARAPENAILGMQAVLRSHSGDMMKATWVFAELDHIVNRSGLTIRDFPQSFKYLYHEAKRRKDLPEGEGFLVSGLEWTLNTVLLFFIQQYDAEATGRHAAAPQ
jgi:hypothetical protein